MIFETADLRNQMVLARGQKIDLAAGENALGRPGLRGHALDQSLLADSL